jgi:hypothetical protein
VTFFIGDHRAAEAQIRERVKEIVSLNPWLDSTLEDVETDASTLSAFYPANHKIFAVRGDIDLRRVAPATNFSEYDEMVAALQPVLCRTTSESVGRNVPLFRVTLIPTPDDDDDDEHPDHPSSSYALVVSANHSLLDGHGFYRLHGMLSADAPVVALNATRSTAAPNAITKAMGSEKSLMKSPPVGFIARFTYGAIRNMLSKKTRAVGFLVSKDFVAAEKRGVATTAGGFVSTNDILVSAFCNALRCDVAMMAINLRGRVDESICGNDDAGNYEDLIGYTPKDYASPELIRKSVAAAPFQRSTDSKMPSNWEHLSATYGAVTNWATFARTLQVDGGVQDLHLPLFDWNKCCPASVCGSMVIFRPREGEIGILCAGSREFVAEIGCSRMRGGKLGVELEKSNN